MSCQLLHDSRLQQKVPLWGFAVATTATLLPVLTSSAARLPQPSRLPCRAASGFTRPDPSFAPRDPGECKDYHARCAEWAEAGECTRNSGFMMGDANTEGTCRKSCKNCEACYDGDVDCVNRNRATGGYLKLDKKEFEWLGVPWWLDEASPEL